MSSSQLPAVRVPDEWMPAIDQRRGERTLSEYVRDLILDDLPRRVAAKLPEAGKAGRRWPDREKSE